VRQARRALAVGLLLAGVVALVADGRLAARTTPPPAATTGQAAPDQPDLSDRPHALTPEELRSKTFTDWRPALAVSPAEARRSGLLLAIVLAASALLAAGGAWWRLRKLCWLPAAAPPPTRPGAPRIFLAPPAATGAQLLDTPQQDILVWGIGRFLSDEATRRLDLAATVKATARRAGIAELRFVRASEQREVWLWLDETAEDSALARLADEIQATLVAHGLPVERASFRGVPERLLGTGGEVFAPREVDERRAHALVAVLTDGRVLARRYAADDQRQRIDALLRGLAHWPQLAFVDFSAGGGELAAILAAHDLALIAPGRLASFLGGSSAGQRANGAGAPTDECAAWAGACALSPAAVDEATAFELRRALGLRVSPWAMREMQRRAPGPPGRLHWPPARRAESVNWLRRAEADVAADAAADGAREMPADSLFAQALAFWEAAYDREIAARAARDYALPWHGTPAEQHLAMERQCLRLWRRAQAGAAIGELYALYQNERHQAAIRRQLGQLAPRGEPPGSGRIELPWSWHERSATEQEMLQKMGFAGDRPHARARAPGRLWLGLAACLGLAAGALLGVLLAPPQPPAGPPLLSHEPALPAAERVELDQLADGNWLLSLSSAHSLLDTRLAPAAEVRVTWREVTQRCAESLAAGSEVWRCASPPRASLRDARIRRRLVVVPAAASAGAAQLAAALLAGGSADVVLFDPAWPAQRRVLLGEREVLRDDEQLLVLSAGTPPADYPLPAGAARAWLHAANWSSLLEALSSSSEVRPASAVWPDARVVAGDPAPIRLAGVGGCRAQEEPADAQGVVFVRLCAGRFRMGSPPDEAGRYDGEGPQHEVALPAFAIARNEVSNAQFRRFRPAHAGADELPATEVSWNDARAFCEHFGYRLPSEAEWEYAARAGTQTRYSFGDDAQELGRYAWFSDNAQARAQPVGTRLANPWGLFDMHGNAWEWVQDCYHDRYDGAPVDGSAWEGGECRYRVLRGGSFANWAEFLRSALRRRFWPEFVIEDIGFRCVRGPRRQP
ncbi:formylglycine-generating enzyme family protein, partial [Accumulibacter sp.]|uniref:formylglycine-generating enzyme family protein n=1 Tax=Accumulibacter sp. TaxID=2053492 RepID=UPI002CB4AB9E